MIPSTCLEIRDLKLLWALAETGGATAAGRTLGLTQSAVSHQLKNLEQRLGLELYVRTGRKLQLTAAGLRLLESAKRTLSEMAELETELRRHEDNAPIPLRLATQCYTAYHWLPQVLPQLLEQYPRAELKIIAEATQHPLDALRNDELDLAIAIGKPKSNRWKAERLFRDELILIASPDNALAQEKKIQPEYLHTQPLFSYNIAATDRARVYQHLFPKGGGFQSVTRLPLTEAIVELVAANLGVSLVASWSVRPQLLQGRIVRLPLAVGPLWRNWYGVYATDTPERHMISEFLRLLRRHTPQKLVPPSAS